MQDIWILYNTETIELLYIMQILKAQYVFFATMKYQAGD